MRNSKIHVHLFLLKSKVNLAEKEKKSEILTKDEGKVWNLHNWMNFKVLNDWNLRIWRDFSTQFNLLGFWELNFFSLFSFLHVDDVSILSLCQQWMLCNVSVSCERSNLIEMLLMVLAYLYASLYFAASIFPLFFPHLKENSNFSFHRVFVYTISTTIINVNQPST